MALIAGERSWRTLPAGIWALGFGSLFMDASSELIHSVLPMFMVTTLGASMITVGLIEGVAEATAAITKVFSGALSDYLGKRKLLMVLGYALAAFTKPIFPLATSVGWVFAARFVDRVGKGIRGAPRDALVADITPASMRGAAYGLRQALDSVGAVIGPMLAVALMIWFADDIRTVMWFAVVPAFITVVLLLVYVREPDRSHARRHGQDAAHAAPMPGAFRCATGSSCCWERSSRWRASARRSWSCAPRTSGSTSSYVPLVMIVMNVVYAGAAYPAGAAADRVSPRTLLLLGLVLLDRRGSRAGRRRHRRSSCSPGPRCGGCTWA